MSGCGGPLPSGMTVEAIRDLPEPVVLAACARSRRRVRARDFSEDSGASSLAAWERRRAMPFIDCLYQGGRAGQEGLRQSSGEQCVATVAGDSRAGGTRGDVERRRGSGGGRCAGGGRGGAGGRGTEASGARRGGAGRNGRGHGDDPKKRRRPGGQYGQVCSRCDSRLPAGPCGGHNSGEPPGWDPDDSPMRPVLEPAAEGIHQDANGPDQMSDGVNELTHLPGRFLVLTNLATSVFRLGESSARMCVQDQGYSLEWHGNVGVDRLWGVVHACLALTGHVVRFTAPG
ncbi:Hypothetical protein ACGLYG10_1685 [Actinomyces glycerinitolerans]|uniref:Uncharacterized protein n=1 Tax=Actinomyces glycerinitolerans TaxID=1892869 RepID=A0A1M4RZW9_9ACTO|nr:Hypothetical protein ACGLYG10_1685 [Actinomyces glycerinitolerans]